MSTSPPRAGSIIEISRIELAPAAFHIGGFLGAEVRNISVKHVERIRGSFVNDHDFVIPAFAAEFATLFTVDPDGPDFLTGDPTTQGLLASNSTPATGTLDLTSHQIRLHIVAGSGGQTLDATFIAGIKQAPVDSDGDGIIDAVDNCPLAFNPDQVVKPPVFGPVPNLVVNVCTEGDTITLVPPSATSTCTPGQVTVEGAVVSINGVTLTPAILLRNNQASLSSGTTVIEWEAKDGKNNMTHAFQTVELRTLPTLYALNSLRVADRSSVRFLDSRAATINNAGTQATEIGADAFVGDVLSVGSIFLRDRGHIDGFVKTAGNITRQNGTTILGPIFTQQQPSLSPFPALSVTFPLSNGGDVNLEPDSQRTLSSGAWGHVSVKSRSTLTLLPGDFRFESLDIEPQAIIVLSKGTSSINIYVHAGLIYRGAFNVNNNDFSNFALGYLGQDQVTLDAPFTGVVIAPQATLALHTVANPSYRGQFFAKSIEVEPDLAVVHQPFVCH